MMLLMGTFILVRARQHTGGRGLVVGSQSGDASPKICARCCAHDKDARSFGKPYCRPHMLSYCGVRIAGTCALRIIVSLPADAEAAMATQDLVVPVYSHTGAVAIAHRSDDMPLQSHASATRRTPALHAGHLSVNISLIPITRGGHGILRHKSEQLDVFCSTAALVAEFSHM